MKTLDKILEGVDDYRFLNGFIFTQKNVSCCIYKKSDENLHSLIATFELPARFLNISVAEDTSILTLTTHVKYGKTEIILPTFEIKEEGERIVYLLSRYSDEENIKISLSNDTSILTKEAHYTGSFIAVMGKNVLNIYNVFGGKRECCIALSEGVAVSSKKENILTFEKDGKETNFCCLRKKALPSDEHNLIVEVI